MKGRTTHARLARLEAQQDAQTAERDVHRARERLAAKLWSMAERAQGAEPTADMPPMQQVACMLWHDSAAARERLKELAIDARQRQEQHQHQRGERYGK